MYRVFSFSILTLFLSVINHAQAQLTLQQCIDTALANNIPVKQKYLQAQSAEVDWRQSRSNILPNLLGFAAHGLSQGKSINPSTNTYVSQNLNYASYQMSSAVTVFNGGNMQNGIKQYASAYEAAKMEWQQEKDNLVLNVILTYLQVLTNEALVESAMNQAQVSAKQLERYQILDSQGAIKPSDLTDLKGQLMNDQLAIVTNKNALETSRLTLAQLMNKSYDPNMQVQNIDVEEFLTSYKYSSNQVYQNALQQFSLIRAVELRRKSLGFGVRSARGLLYPNLFLDGGLSTRYSSIEQDQVTGAKVPYNNQISNNLASYVEVGISIPILNRSLYRTRG